MGSSRRPFSIIINYLPMSVLKYAPSMLYTATYLPLCASVTSVINNESNSTVGDVASSFLIFVLFLLPSAHALPLVVLARFYFWNINNLRDYLLCSYISYPYARGSMASLLCR